MLDTLGHEAIESLCELAILNIFVSARHLVETLELFKGLISISELN